MPVVLYHWPISPPSRIVLAVSKLSEEYRETPIIFFGKRSLDADAKAAIREALGILEKYLEPTGWVAGDQPTVADISCSVTTGSMKFLGAPCRFLRCSGGRCRCIRLLVPLSAVVDSLVAGDNFLE
ncbi:uncharacterized protein LOC126282396 [Schistocerca gregaria]|uniref:uncharacterized protein LOC126282396 n=1 Tax=Schistocerca gregaria TaxID=7010 RepID=UPI00211E7C65|nr:uncharacterized protein LOC126282396 [Schistocerca gregaria]